MTTFIKPDTSRIKQFSNGLAFEQLTYDERLSYFRKAGNIMKLKNNKLVTGEDKTSSTDHTYHDDFFVYYPSVVGNLPKNTDRVVLAIPRDIVKYAFYTKVGNKLHEIMKEDHEDECSGSGTLKRVLAIVRIISSETGINVPMYYYNLDKNMMYMPFRYNSGTVHAMVPRTTAEGSSSGNVYLDWIDLSTERKINISDIPLFYYHDEMNVALLFEAVSSGKFSRITTVMERVLLKKNFVVDTNTVEDETITEVLFEELKV